MSEQVQSAPPISPPAVSVPRLALVGNPNTGKTTLFNRLTGLRHKTSNFAGTTLDARTGRATLAGLIPAALTPTPQPAPTPLSAAAPTSPARGATHNGPARHVELIDLPGVYSLELEQLESRVAREVLAGTRGPSGVPVAEPDGILVVLDATNMARNLMLAGEALRRRLPTVVAVNMIDLARAQGLRIDAGVLSARLGCPVVLVSARTGEGVDAALRAAVWVVDSGAVPTHTPPGDEQGLRAWAEELFTAACAAALGPGPLLAHQRRTDRADRVLTHPVLGLLVFACVMSGLFGAIFWLAQFPMDWIEWIFATAGDALRQVLGPGLLRELLINGVAAGVGATVVFVPQIALLFFLISLLEDTGYLARAALLMDRLLRPFGLPGHSFVPLLSSHACALPGIIATRTIPDRRERLATILAAPFMTCSARLPVYVLLTGLLFAGRPLLAGLAFVGCYALGIVAGVLSALLARRTILRGAARPMAIELPSYKRPSVRTALITAVDRAVIFIKKAGTAILAVSILLWWLGSFPHAGPSPQGEALRAQAAQVATAEPERAGPASTASAEQLRNEAAHADARAAKASSYLGRLGHAAEPIFAPIGADWQLSVGILASFAAREVFVGTMSVVIAGAEVGDDEGENTRIRAALGEAKRADGSLLFTPAASWAMLVFYVLAMQCLPTLVVTAREAGDVRWALLQFAWMTTLAYVGAWLAFKLAS